MRMDDPYSLLPLGRYSPLDQILGGMFVLC
jgi:hypothetical protein